MCEYVLVVRRAPAFREPLVDGSMVNETKLHFLRVGRRRSAKPFKFVPGAPTTARAPESRLFGAIVITAAGAGLSA